MARKHADPGKAEAATERRLQALELRKAGANYRRIGAQLGVSEAQAYKDVQGELQRIQAEASDLAADVRTLELERLDALTLALWPSARQGKEGAIDRVLRVMERRSKLLGLDAPTKQDVRIEDMSKLSDDELRAIAEG